MLLFLVPAFSREGAALVVPLLLVLVVVMVVGGVGGTKADSPTPQSYQREPIQKFPFIMFKSVS